MSDPVFVFDGRNRLWQLDVGDKYYCKGPGEIPRSCTLTELAIKHGPVNHITKGPEVKVPEIIPNGTWVEFDLAALGDHIWGQVESYDAEGIYYEVTVKVGRDKVHVVDL